MMEETGTDATAAVATAYPDNIKPPSKSAHENDGKTKYGNRDIIGYGKSPVQPHWPNKAKVALNFVINYEEGGEKHHAFNGALMGEMAAQKSKYARKLASMEKTLEQMRSEKNQLNNVLETQRQNFKLAIQQTEMKNAQIIKELRDGQRKKVDELPAF